MEPRPDWREEQDLEAHRKGHLLQESDEPGESDEDDDVEAHSLRPRPTSL